jgi:segregation and condensation protein B
MVSDNIIEKLEAILFASGKAMTTEALMDVIEETNKKEVKQALKKLKESYDKRGSAVMLLEQEDAWKLTVREKYLPLVRKIVADTELPKTVLETLAVIAWKSPILQSNVIKVRTNKAYEHIDLLERLGFITRKKEGRSFRISLAEKFFEYFDVREGDIRTMFKDAKGIEKELENEQAKKSQEQDIATDAEGQQIKDDIDHDIDVEKAVSAENDHLGSLEVVDAIEDKEPAESIEIVDTINDPKVVRKEDDVEEIDEVLEEIDEAEEAKEEVEEVMEDAITSEDEKH